MNTDNYWIVENGNKQGPFTINQLKTMWGSGQITGDSLYWQEGFDEPIQVSFMLDILEPAPELQHTKRTLSKKFTESGKCILPLLLLWLFLGVIGAHRFYAGKTGTGVLFIIMLISCPFLFYIPLVVLACWIVIDFILIVTGSFTDANGLKIQSWT